jgi:uncharacterized membrane protein
MVLGLHAPAGVSWSALWPLLPGLLSYFVALMWIVPDRRIELRATGAS